MNAKPGKQADGSFIIDGEDLENPYERKVGKEFSSPASATSGLASYSIEGKGGAALRSRKRRAAARLKATTIN